MRELILDTETTGLNVPENRIIELGFVEHLNGSPTGLEYQQFFNPEMAIHEDAKKVHGIGDEDLQDMPLFADKVEELLEYFKEAKLVVHNAEFDIAFINKELEYCNKPPILSHQVIDTLDLARRMLPEKGHHSLDALCNHFKIDLSKRTKHGALLDAQYLSEIYIRLKQEEAPDLIESNIDSLLSNSARKRRHSKRLVRIGSQITEAEAEAHENYVASQLGANSIWTQYRVNK
ncbi:MAG: DNA polymerase III subunit epsilon [Rhodobacteraceae bacterium]|nr:DNA polymerase III subunit epsilon [Paracoccaceae bacterium]